MSEVDISLNEISEGRRFVVGTFEYFTILSADGL
jgi:hypothetical protein